MLTDVAPTALTRKAAPPGPVEYIAGLDLGQVRDFSALALLERTRAPDVPGGRLSYRYACRFRHRWPLGTPYVGTKGQPGIAEDTAALLGKLPAGCTLVVDQTGVGRAVYEELRRAGLPVERPIAAPPGSVAPRLMPVTITGGAGPGTYAAGGQGWTVPKRTLASVLQAVLGTRRLQVAPALPLAAVLVRELETFSVKINLATGAETFEAWRERDHDDLVLAVALACWCGESRCRTIA
jgi:hypothetical protein